MNYQECIHYLEEEVGFGSVPGLERIKCLCERLGNPQQKLSVIHIAGTNGKGSAVAMLSSILKEAGYRVGTYTSPHLEKYNERFLINGKEISDEDFTREITLMKNICEELAAEGKAVPTLFEIVTGVAFHYFAEQKVDVLILEVGLGGRYDATNIVAEPLLSLIMSISIDHTDFLGDSIEKIAAEKAGIIKKNCPVVLYSQDEIVYNMVKDAADRMDAPFYCLNDAEIDVASQTLEGSVFSVKNKSMSLEKVELPLLGSYQISNCVTVLEACRVLKKRGLQLSEEAVRRGLKNAHWAGRMEICRKEPLVILDGAHNEDGIHQLAKSLSVYFRDKKVTLILGVLGDKEYHKMAEHILPHADSVILTEPHSERKLDVFTLARSISNHNGTIYTEKEIEDAYEKALSLTPAEGIILCCGSLYMIGAMRTYITNRSR
ncbi:bifunctional folylpolyglutamate synthase/dihydrofolate synthase [Anaerotignum sp.]|nr:folylpolyglutamate synthase/dihydrofolate synthase family protein [Anaerotignum sp.]MBQ7757598.1 bifunctional folylpolyglutamate synthase/dihydrofolate synthase [Anaerotignum sp.]